MAAYFTSGGAGTDVQSGTDGLQTLYFMNPNYVGVGYADAAPVAANMMLLNSAVGSLAPASFGHHQPAPPAAQHLVGIPLQPPHSGSYNLWASAAGDMSPRLQQQGAPGTSAVSAVLSLSSREAPPVTVASVPGTEGMYMGASQQEQVLMSSRYLKPAQELLDEAVSVSTGLEEANAAAKSAAAVKKMEDFEGASSGGAEDGGGGKNSDAAEMSTAERQDLQMKKNKLVNMLDEVDRRYRQYHQQMQAVASSFEAAAGIGSARTYTALALCTISRRFRCLRDTIAAQVRSASRILGEDYADGGGGRRTVGSRLRLIDHQLRKQRALQQLGMAQQLDGGGGAWRPQRGLPEHSVSVLRAWLFEHFLHPYPKDSDKVMLAKQTGLTRGQVSNWFINARVRLWKPMVEEMYLEETKGKVDDDDGDGGSSSRMSNNTADSARHGNGVSSSSSKQVVDHVHAASTTLVGPLPGDQHRLKKTRTRTTDEPAAFHVSNVAAPEEAQAAAAARREEEVSHRELLMKFMEAGGSGERDNHQDGVGGYSLFTPAPFGQFGSEEQFAFAGNGSGVSLTLGLPHGGAAEQADSFLMGGSSNASDGAITADYGMNMQNTKSLAAQLMRDFAAHN